MTKLLEMLSALVSSVLLGTVPERVYNVVTGLLDTIRIEWRENEKYISELQQGLCDMEAERDHILDRYNELKAGTIGCGDRLKNVHVFFSNHDNQDVLVDIISASIPNPGERSNKIPVIQLLKALTGQHLLDAKLLAENIFRF